MHFPGRKTHGSGRTCFLLLLALLLTSCAVNPLRYVNPLSDLEELPGKGRVVFGRIKVTENGQPVEYGAWRSFIVIIIPDAGPEPTPYIYNLTGDGSFYWNLPPDGYMITEFNWHRGFWDPKTGRRRSILARFVIPEAKSPIYTGTLTIRLEADHYTMDVEDEYDLALQRLKQQFPEVKGPVAKRLMQLELQ